MEVAVDVETFAGPRACELAGITYRQLDYWCRTGLIEPSVPSRGSGTRRRFSRRDVQILAILGRVAFSIRPDLATALRDLDPLPPWVVVARGWNVRPCSTRDELTAAILAETSGVVRLIVTDTLVDFDAVGSRRG